MSYRGRPSKGCESCRSRKVKCDESKPTCNRCTKSGLECRYRDQGDLLFRNQTAFAAQKAEESWRKRAKSHQRQPSEGSSSNNRSPNSKSLSPPLTSDHHPSPCNSHDSPHSESTSDTSNAITSFNDLTIGSEIQPDLRQLAYDRFIYDFVVLDNPSQPAGEPSNNLWSFIPLLYESSKEGSCFKTVVTAVSYANYSTRCDAPFAQGLAEDFLGKGIKQLQKQIADKNLASTDETLGAVYMMGVWENLVTPRRDGTFVAHKEGANALLHLRTIDEFYSNPVSARLYEASFTQMLIGNLHSAKPPTVPIGNVVTTRQHLPTLYSTSGIYIIQLIHNEATLHAKWSDLKTSANPPTTREELRDLLEEALLLEAEFQTWESTIPSSWAYETWQNTAEFRSQYPYKWTNVILGSKGAPQEMHGYRTLKRCWIWMFYRTTRILLLRDLLEMLNWAFRMPEPAPTTMSSGMSNPQSTTLDTLTLEIHHSLATNNLAKVVEDSCAAVACHFTVPIHGKTMEDVPGMRGYTAFWCLGVIDAVLRLGLVRDSASNPTQSSAYHDPVIDPQLNQPPTSGPNPFYGLSTSSNPFTGPSSSSNSFASQDMGFTSTTPIHPHYQNLSSGTTNPTDNFRGLDSLGPPSQNPFFRADPNLAIPPSLASPPLTQPLSKTHAMDTIQAHEWDSAPELPPLNFGGAATHTVDIAARRAWIQRVTYYMATRLGIRKGLAMVVMEGYLEKSKAEVERLLA